jgi:hypothetical protein
MRLITVVLVFLCLNVFGQKFTGVSLEAPPKAIGPNDLNSIVQLNAKWVGIIPFGFLDKGKTTIRYDFEHQWWGERKKGIVRSIQIAKSKKLKVMLKPQLWIKDQFVGDIDFTDSPKKWTLLEKNYTTFLLDFARIADSLDVDLLSIGCEFKKWVIKRPIFWNKLIVKIKSVYKGELTYSANWDNFEQVKFWSKLDYIGVDSYFPLSELKTPGIKVMNDKWRRIKPSLKKISNKHNRKVLFTEYGFRSVDSNVKETWDSEKPGAVNQIAQKNAYEAMFSSIWKEDWFAGGFLWKWKADHVKAGGKTDNRFTPQNKLAEAVIRTNFLLINDAKK